MTTYKGNEEALYNQLNSHVLCLCRNNIGFLRRRSLFIQRGGAAWNDATGAANCAIAVRRVVLRCRSRLGGTVQCCKLRRVPKISQVLLRDIFLILTCVCRGEHLLGGRSGSLILCGKSRGILFNRGRIDGVLALKVAATKRKRNIN